MQSFKQWRMLNESLFPLGLSQTPNVAPIVSQFQFDEKKKNMDKNPEMEDDEDYDDDEEADDEDEEGDESDEEGDESDDEGDDEGGDDAPAFKKKGGDEEGSFPAFMKKKGMKKKKKKMKNECDCDGGKKKPIESDDDDGDEDMGGDDDGDNGDGEGADMKRPLGFMKKKMKKKMKKESANPQNDFLQSFNSYTAPGNQMTSEDAWWKSVNSHFNNPDQKFGDGFTEYMEDYLIDPNAAEQFRSENDKQKGPAPGEVGFAPQQRMGYFGTPEGQA